jgi:hypothetical protein
MRSVTMVTGSSIEWSDDGVLMCCRTSHHEQHPNEQERYGHESDARKTTIKLINIHNATKRTGGCWTCFGDDG